DPEARVGDLPVGVRQRVEIIKCLRHDPGIIIFDEPTSVLTPAESQELFGVLRRVVASARRTVALVSPQLGEVMHATPPVTVMRQGRIVASYATPSATPASLARAMLGRDVSLRSEAAALGIINEAAADLHQSTSRAEPTPALVLEGLRVRSRDGRMLLDGLSL